MNTRGDGIGPPMGTQIGLACIVFSVGFAFTASWLARKDVDLFNFIFGKHLGDRSVRLLTMSRYVVAALLLGGGIVLILVS